MAQLLKNLSVVEVSLVGTPANKKRFALFKSADEVSVSEKPVAKAEEAPAPQEDKKPAEEAPAPTEKAMCTCPECGAEFDPAAAEAAAEDAAPPSEDEIAKMAPQVQKLFKMKADLEAAKEAAEKATAEAVAKAAEIEKTLLAERESKETADSIAKAKEDFAGLPVKAEDLGPALRSIRKSDPAAAEAIESVLKSCKALVAKALEPVGQAPAVEDNTSAWDRVQKQAKEMVAKGEAKTEAIAIATLMKDSQLMAAVYAEKDK